MGRIRLLARSGPKTVAVTGASGLVGSALVGLLEAGGHAVRRVARDATGAIATGDLVDVDAVVHLAGENIAAGRWTAACKERIRASRVVGTARVAQALAALPRRPAVLVTASAIGFYGDRGSAPLDESSPPGAGFLADTCRAWEEAAGPAEQAGIRVVRLRIGIVLAAAGGALARMLPPFRLGLGGRIGDGRQVMSWIALDDLVGAILHVLADESVAGPVNAVAPGALANAEFARTLGRVLGRPARLPLPAVAVRLLLGEMGQELLLAGARVVPARLSSSGFGFRHPDLEGALRFELGRLLPDPEGPEARMV